MKHKPSRGVIKKVSGQRNAARYAFQSLYSSPKRIHNHVSNILYMLRVADRAEAMVRAREAGLG